MITNRETSLAKLKEFFEDSLSELNIPELIFLETNLNSKQLNGLIISNDNLTVNLPIFFRNKLFNFQFLVIGKF